MGWKRQYLIRVGIGLGALFFAVLVTLLASREASASTSSDCSADSGSWSGADPDIGTCEYPANTAVAMSACGADHQYTIIYFSDESTQDYCTFVAPSATTSSTPQQGGCRSEVRGPLETRVTLALCHGKNGAATFPAGGCYIKCTITSALPAAAERKLPSTDYATIYVRSVAPGGLVGEDSYVVCFSLQDLDLNPAIIFRFVGGAWVPVAIGNSESTLICASGSGDGAFFLGQPPKKNHEE